MTDKEAVIRILARSGNNFIISRKYFKAADCFRLINNIVNDAPIASIIQEAEKCGLIKKKQNQEK